jgi:hypothetical protein
MRSFRAGEPLVEVYDWHRFWLDKYDPYKLKPIPVVRLKLSEARRTGLAWKCR